MRSDPKKTAYIWLGLSLANLILFAAACASKNGLPGPLPTATTSTMLTSETATNPAAQSAPAQKITAATGLVDTPISGTLTIGSTLPPATNPPGAALLPPAAWAPAAPCAESTCPRLVVTQAGQQDRLELTSQGIRAQAALSLALPAEKSQNGRWIIDTGMPSPDGKWAAYTSIGNETGGPVFLQDLASGEYTNLIDAVNQHRPEGQPELASDYQWDVIGWFPDSRQLMIGPADASTVCVIELSSYAARTIAFPGGGKGGRLFVNLAPDGSRFFYIGEEPSGDQAINAYNLTSGETTTLQTRSYNQGVLYAPQAAPDGKTLAYLLEKSPPATGKAVSGVPAPVAVTVSIDLLPLDGGAPRTLVDDTRGLTTLAWSPDGKALAFTKNETAATLSAAAQNATPEPMRGNVWTVSAADGRQTQITFLSGLARSPVWASDSQTLAFVTQDGQVGVASTTQPGKMWQAAGPAPAYPELTSAFFIP
jgi:dipeptidyl aminopeptidase/acylaminoacyl peptidase